MINFDMLLFEKIFDSFNLEVEPEISELDDIDAVFDLKVLYEKLTLKIAIEESIKLWNFLSQDGRRTKEDYFDTEDAAKILNAGCFLCEYTKIEWLKSEIKEYKNMCRVAGCPLDKPHLCKFNFPGSAFNIWMKNNSGSDSSLKDRLLLRRAAAREILKALKKALEELDETDEKDEV